MAQPRYMKPWKMIIPGGMYRQLHDHLFCGDNEEHGAVALAGRAETDRDVRLLVRELHIARDGIDCVPGKRGHRMLRGEFITERITRARDEKLVYVSIHNHPGSGAVRFSDVDLRSHERGYPALLQIARGVPVGALVFSSNAVAGDFWLQDGTRVPLASAHVVGTRREVLTDSPNLSAAKADLRYDRQVRLFGDRGQDILSNATVAIVGLGGVGSLVAEYLGRLGVGRFVLIDPDDVEDTNLPRLVGASRWSVRRKKVKIARRSIRRANPRATVKTICEDLLKEHVANHLKDCDYIFLAADTMRARLLFNAIVYQYLVRGVQIGTQIREDKEGTIRDIYSVTRPVTPESGCLRCNELISPAKLQSEALSEKERRVQAYVDDPAVQAPSVMALNALDSAQAANDFMFYMTGLMEDQYESAYDYMFFHPLHRKVVNHVPSVSTSCQDCGKVPKSRFARGDGMPLPSKMSGRRGRRR